MTGYVDSVTMWMGPGAFSRCVNCHRLLLVPLGYWSRMRDNQHPTPITLSPVCGDCARRYAKVER